MSPKNGTAGSVITPLDPLKAENAVIASPGELQLARPNGAAKVANRGALSTPPAPKSESGTKPCTLKTLEVTCSHGRKPGKGPQGLLLQVVPSKMVVVKDSLSGSSFEASGGTSDKLTVHAKYHAVCGGIHPEISISGPACAIAHATSYVTNAQGPASVPLWPAEIQPSVYTMTAEGCAGTVQPVNVECFPPQTINAKIDGKEWSQRLDPIRSVAVELVNALNGDDGFQIKYLEGTVSGEWGWQEYKDYRAYFGFNIQLGMNPFFGIDQARIKVSVAEWVPSPIRNHAADLFAFLGFAGDISLNLFWKKEGPDEKNEQFGGGAEAKVGVSLGVEATAGSGVIVKVTITAQIKCDISVSGSAIYERTEGPGLSASAERGDLAGEIECRTKAGGIFKWLETENSAAVIFCPKRELWSGEKIWLMHEANGAL
jgi:hypothetical protein